MTRHPGTAAEVLWAFFKLGLTSFGGPVAHLAYFRTEFVERRRWLDDKHYSDLVALCQFLPGPASSQVGMALGQGRAGWQGALAAWLGFTLPSALALVLFAHGLAQWSWLTQSGVVHGLKLMSVAVVAQAVWGMSRTLCPDRLRAGIALAAAMMMLSFSTVWSQVIVMVCGGVIGWRWLLLPSAPSCSAPLGISRKAGIVWLGLFALLLLGLPSLAANSESITLSTVASFYQSGALVFGGGHVVLPLLQHAVVPTGLVSSDTFLAGYGAAQAIPGPLFAFAAFVGAVMPAPMGGWMGAVVLLMALFLPAFLLVMGALPFWDRLRQHHGIQQAMGGINAAVVGILGAALYDPIWSGTIASPADGALVVLALGMLVLAKASPLVVLLMLTTASGLMAM